MIRRKESRTRGPGRMIPQRKTYDSKISRLGHSCLSQLDEEVSSIQGAKGTRGCGKKQGSNGVWEVFMSKPILGFKDERETLHSMRADRKPEALIDL